MKKHTKGAILASFFTLCLLTSLRAMESPLESQIPFKELINHFNEKGGIDDFLEIHRNYTNGCLENKDVDQLKITSIPEKIWSLGDDAKSTFLLFFLEKNSDETGAFMELEILSQASPTAMVNLGLYYDHGKGGSQDFKKAVTLYQKAADQGYARAQYMLGSCYKSGDGVEKNIDIAVELFQKAAAQGYARAQYSLGGDSLFGRGADRDIKKAREWLEKAANQGHCESQHLLGLIYSENQDYKNAFYWFQKGINQGHAGSTCMLAVHYRDGLGVKQDFTKAVELFQKAADLGDEEARYTLGQLHLTGQGVKKDPKKAFQLFKELAGEGYALAQCALGHLYTEQGAEQDFDLAVKYYDLAFKNGLPYKDHKHVYKPIIKRRKIDQDIISMLKSNENFASYFSKLNEGECSVDDAKEMIDVFFERRQFMVLWGKALRLSPENHKEINGLFDLFVGSGLILEKTKAEVKKIFVLKNSSDTLKDLYKYI